MLNRPTSPWSEDSSRELITWDVDRNPKFRFGLLWIAFVLPILAICGRAAQLQLELQDDFSTAFSKTTEIVEEIPASTGRILSADGVVLAMDAQTFEIAVEYPVIQDPLDETWVTNKAKARLSKKERRDKKQLADEKAKIVLETEQFWDELAQLTNRTANEILAERRKVQSRIEPIKASHLRRYQEGQTAVIPSVVADENASIWSRFVFWLQSNATRDRPDWSDRFVKEERQHHIIIADVSADIRDEIKAHAMRYPYAKVLVQSRRTYPQGDLAAHLIGHRKPLSEEELKDRLARYPNGDPQDYRLGDPGGLSGLERQYDVLLKGVRGKRLLVKNRRGDIVDTREIEPPRHGRDLVLRLDSRIQLQAEQRLDRAIKQVTLPEHDDSEASRKSYTAPNCPQGGAIVALDIHTGEIIAAAAAPRFDLNLRISADAERWDDVISDKRSPLFSRATKMKLTPGSVFKVITAIASIESGAMSPETICHCQGYLDSPDKHRCYTFIHQHAGHGDVTLVDALSRSCNVYFYTAARRMGPQPIVDWARKMGIGQPTGIDLPAEEEKAGRLPAPDTQKARWRPGDTLDLSIGQSTLEVTPLQMVRVMAAIANGGNLVTPRLAANFGPASIDESESNTNSLSETEAPPIQGLHSSTLDQIRKGLTMTVHDPHGTGYKTVRMKEVTIAGKTGTAQTNGVDHAWFAGYVPAERPRIAFVVVLEHGGSGGKAAGPVAHDFVKSLLDFDVLKATKPPSEYVQSRH
jgi:penicillin-binding protein 2